MNTSWPVPAATAEAAAAWMRSAGIWSTTTLVSCCRPHSSASSPANHASYSGMKCAHLAIFNVGWLVCARPGTATNGAATAVAASLTTSRRDGVVVRTLVIPMMPGHSVGVRPADVSSWRPKGKLRPDASPAATRFQTSQVAAPGFANSGRLAAVVSGPGKLSHLLEAFEVLKETWIDRLAVRECDVIEESVRRDRPVARIQYAGADDPDRS